MNRHLACESGTYATFTSDIESANFVFSLNELNFANNPGWCTRKQCVLPGY
jgi:hypothetical protein